MSTANFHDGNAFNEGQDTRQWFVGGFMPPDRFESALPSLLHDQRVEVKLYRQKAGERRECDYADDERKTLSVLISGRVEFLLIDGGAKVNHKLTREGDFVIFNPGVYHAWRVHEDSFMFTVRWKP